MVSKNGTRNSIEFSKSKHPRQKKTRTVMGNVYCILGFFRTPIGMMVD